jgi:hypothetical protein
MELFNIFTMVVIKMTVYNNLYHNLSITVTNTQLFILQGIKVYLAMVLEVSVHGHFALLLWNNTLW